MYGVITAREELSLETSFINYIAECTAKTLELETTPRFVRWVRTRGHARQHYYGRHEPVFVLPRWLRYENSFSQIAYIAHEVAHHSSWDDVSNDVNGGHGTKFYEAERKALLAFSLEPRYRIGYRYVVELLAAGTNVPVWTKLTGHGERLRHSLHRDGDFYY